jgi:hypothetical protein
VPAVAAAFAGGYAEWRAAVADGWTAAAAAEAGAAGGRTVAPAGPVRAGRSQTGGEHTRRPAAARPARGAGSATPRLSKDFYRRQRAAVDADLTRLGLRRAQLELALTTQAVRTSFVELGRVTSELADVTEALNAAEEAWLALEERAPEGRG